MENIIVTKTRIVGNLRALIRHFLSNHPDLNRGLRNNIFEIYRKQKCPGFLNKDQLDFITVNKKPFKKWVERNTTKLLNSKKSIAKQSLFPPKAVPKKETEFKMEFTKKGYFTAETQKILMAYLSDPTFDTVIFKGTEAINTFIVERHPGERKPKLERFVLQRVSYAPDHKTILDIAEMEVNASNMLTIGGKISRDIMWLFSEKNTAYEDFEIKRIL